jgi:hypothetical protein
MLWRGAKGESRTDAADQTTRIVVQSSDANCARRIVMRFGVGSASLRALAPRDARRPVSGMIDAVPIAVISLNLHQDESGNQQDEEDEKLH